MLKLHNVSHVYVHNGSLVTALENISLTVKEGEFVALIGPSGCGKSTFLKLIAGLLKPTSGTILLNGKPITGPGRNRGWVPQQYSLFPWLTVEENIAFGLKLKNKPNEEIDRMVNHYLVVTGLTEFKNAYPKNLSGGMQQRVAIARTLAVNPEILLMDEPFGSLDAMTRAKMQDFLLDLHQRDRKTVLFVTHDIEEALFLADTVYTLTSRPEKMKKRITVPFPRPRPHELKFTPEFLLLVRQTSSDLANG